MKPLYATCCCILLSLAVTPAFAQAGPGKNLEFNGTSNYVQTSAINLSGSALTLQAWIRVDAFKTAFPYISSVIGTETTGNTALLRLGDATLANNKLQFVLYSGSSQMKLDGVTGLSTNTWYHVAATFDGSTMKLYINGVLDASMSFAGSVVSNDFFGIGRNYGNDRILDGQIDEVSVFKAALSQQSIRDWMCRKITSGHPNYGALEGYWPLNEGTGATTADASGNGYTGTLTGTPTWKTSGAPIGDRSKHQYGSAFSIGMSHPMGDSLHLVHTSGTVTGVHLYRVDSVPNNTAAPAPLLYLDTTHYWGVFVMGTSNYAAGYFYDGNALVTGSNVCNIGFALRSNNAATTWANLNLDAVDYVNEIVAFLETGTREFILGISSNGPHAFNYTITEPLCNGGTDGAATVHVSGGLAPYSYAWAGGSTDSTATGLAGGWQVVTITDSNGCTSTDSVFVTEPSTIGVVANITPATCLYTNNGSISITAVGGAGGYTYLWNDPANSTTSSVSGLYAGIYTLTVTDSHNCSYPHTFTVNSTGPDPIPDLGPDTNICGNKVFGLVADITGGPPTSYQWSTGETGAIKIVSTSGTYSLTVTNAAGCIGIDSITITYVEPLQIDLGNDVTATGSHVLDAGAGGAFTAFHWSTGASGQAITINTTGNYSVTATDSNGCKSSDTVKVTILPQSVSEVQTNSGFQCFPNPTAGWLWVKSTDPSIGKGLVMITDPTGRTVYSEEFNSPSIELDIRSLGTGVYFLNIVANNTYYTTRILKSKP